MQRSTISRDVEQQAWDAFVDSHPGATLYHRYAWRRVIEKSFGHPTRYLAAVDDGGRVTGILPLVHMRSLLFGNFLVSVPFFNYGGLLCREERAGDELLSAAGELRLECGAKHVELRHVGHGLAGLATREHKVTMVLRLADDAAAQWEAFNAKLRNQIRKALKNDLACWVGDLDLLDEFYDIFARNMRDLGTPVYGKEFFRNVLKSFPEESRIVVVRRGAVAMAAGIILHFRNTMEMPWASSIADFKSYCPNNLLYWKAIQLAIGKGCRFFDFGRSTPNEGTFNFKKQWGAEPVQLYWQYLMEEGTPMPELNPKNARYERAIKTWQKLPVALTKVVGPLIVRSIP